MWIWMWGGMRMTEGGLGGVVGWGGVGRWWWKGVGGCV